MGSAASPMIGASRAAQSVLSGGQSQIRGTLAERDDFGRKSAKTFLLPGLSLGTSVSQFCFWSET